MVDLGPIRWARRRTSVRVKLYALSIPLAVLSGLLVIATVVPYRATQDRITIAREDISAVMASRRVEQNTVGSMWHTLRLVLTGDAEAARSIEHSERVSSEALATWRSSERGRLMKSKLAEMSRQKGVLDALTDQVTATVESGDLLTAREEFYEDVYPAFDQGFDEDVDELLRHQDVQLRDGFNGLAGATGPAESLFGGKRLALIAEASGHVAHSEIAADFIAELTDASVEMVEFALEAEPDLEEAADKRLEVARVLASWERSVVRSTSAAAHVPIVRRLLDRFYELGNIEDAVLARAKDDDVPGAVELLAGPYTTQLQQIVSDAERFIVGEELEITSIVDRITGDARTINALMAIGAICLFLIGGAFVVVLARNLSRRLRTLTDAADRMGSGDLSVRVDVDATDELGALSRSFNAMGEELSDAHGRLASLFGRTVEAGEHERTKLAADLHDGPVQRLAAAGYVVGRISQLIARGATDVAEPLLDGLEESINTEVGSLRRMMSELRPPALDTRGLRAAVGDYATQFGARNGIGISVEACDERLAPALETTIYRVMQEALTNVAKHADASAVELTITRQDDAVVLSVRDDGVGFSPSENVASIEHFGLDGMEQRVKIAGGSWHVESTLHQGTTVSARFPVTQEAANGGAPIDRSSPRELAPLP
jgi:signal transduction histidine kinase